MQNKLLKYGIALGLISVLAACSKVPKEILSEKEMQNVLTDMMIADAMIGADYTTYANDTTKMALYDAVFRKHNINQAKYDSSLVWYGRNLDIYMKVYDRVLLAVNKQIANLGDIQADATPATGRDSVNIWPRRATLVFSPKSVFNGTTFDLTPDSPYPSGSSFVLGLRVWGLTPEIYNFPEVRISAEQQDTIITVENKIMADGYYETVLNTLATRQVKRVYGYIRMDNSDSTYFKVYVDSLNLMRYNYGTPFSAKEIMEPVAAEPVEITPLSDTN